MAKLSIENAIYDISGLREKIVRILSERNYMEIRGDHIVRVPRIPGRIFERDNGYGHILIDLIYQRWYDPEAKQSRNRRATIGETLDICPMAMIPTERYTEFFDLETGELDYRDGVISGSVALSYIGGIDMSVSFNAEEWVKDFEKTVNDFTHGDFTSAAERAKDLLFINTDSPRTVLDYISKIF